MTFRPRIRIEGMRHIEHLISRVWLVELVCRFLEESRLYLPGRRIRIVVKKDLTDDVDHPEEGMVMVTVTNSTEEEVESSRIKFGTYTHFRRSDQIVLHVGQATTLRGLLYTFYHELDHLGWRHTEGEFDESQPYRERPHEVRARQTSRTWVVRLLGESGVHPKFTVVEGGRGRVRPATKVVVAPWVDDPDWAEHFEVRS